MEENITQEEPQLPPIDFISFISDLITTAYLYLQGFRDPETEQVIVNLGLAKRMIDTLEMLEEKTKGNLTAPESNFLANSLYDLRMGYVRAVDSQKDALEQDASDDTPEQDAPSEDDTSTEPEKMTNGEAKNNA